MSHEKFRSIWLPCRMCLEMSRIYVTVRKTASVCADTRNWSLQILLLRVFSCDSTFVYEFFKMSDWMTHTVPPPWSPPFLRIYLLWEWHRENFYLYKAGRHASVLKLPGSNLGSYSPCVLIFSWFTSASAADLRALRSYRSGSPRSKCCCHYSRLSP